jgi:hypothetical protein
MPERQHTAEELTSALKESGAEILGTIALSDSQKATIKKVTGIETGKLDVARIVKGDAMIFAMPSVSSW